MVLSKLDIRHVRNLTDVHLTCVPGVNYIFGGNAAGKSAILEAIHLLASARSFRTPRVREVIQHGKESLTVTAILIDGQQNPQRTGIEKSACRTQIRFGGMPVKKRSEQIRNIPLFSIVPESMSLLAGPPKSRRHWLDWALFHVERNYFDHWHAYHQALRQRNALLRWGQGNPTQYESWEQSMAMNAARLRKSRQCYLQAIQQRLNQLMEIEDTTVELSLKAAEDSEDNLLQKLALQRPGDIRQGHTQSGPHRDDIIMTSEGHKAARRLSRGEIKRLVIFLILAQTGHYRSVCGQNPILIFDDLTAELDSQRVGEMLEHIQNQGQQAFITATERNQIPGYRPGDQGFHVEHGRLQKMVN